MGGELEIHFTNAEGGKDIKTKEETSGVSNVVPMAKYFTCNSFSTSKYFLFLLFGVCFPIETSDCPDIKHELHFFMFLFM